MSDPQKPKPKPLTYGPEDITPPAVTYGPGDITPMVADASAMTGKKGNWGSTKDYARIAEDQLTFGLATKINAAMRGLFTSETYQNAKADEKKKLAEAWTHDGAFAAAVAGNIPMLVGPAILKGPKAAAAVAKELKFLQKVGQGVAAGVKVGAVHGAANADWDAEGTSIGARLLAAGKGAIKGGAIGGAAGGVLGGAAGAPGSIKATSQNITARAEQAAAAGVPLTAGQKINSSFVKGIESALSVLPTGRGRMGRFGEEQAVAVKTRAEEIAARMAKGEVPSVEDAGYLAMDEAKRIGLGYEARRAPLAETFKEKVDKAFPSVAPTAGMTKQEAAVAFPNDRALRAEIGQAVASGNPTKIKEVLSAPYQAAAAPTGGIKLPEVEALVADLQKQSLKKSFEADIAPVLTEAEKILVDASNGTLNAADLLKLRTKLGSRANFTSPLAGPDPTKEHVTSLWKALSGDVKSIAKSAGPEAEKALLKHDEMVHSFRRSDNPTGADFWSAVEDAKTPEQAFRLITSTPNNAAAARAIRTRMGPDAYGKIQARNFLDMGKANASVQDVGGDVFSPESLVSRWNGKGLTPEVKREMFGDGAALPADLTGLLGTAGDIKSSSFYRNLSGTAGMLQGTQAFRDIANVVTGSGATAATGTGAAGVAGLIGLTPAAGALGVGLATPWLGARAATSPLTSGAIDLAAKAGGLIPNFITKNAERAIPGIGRTAGNIFPSWAGNR